MRIHLEEHPVVWGMLAATTAFFVGVVCVEILFLRPLQNSVSHGMLRQSELRVEPGR